MERFKVNSIERRSRFDGTPSYTLRGLDGRENPAVFSVPREQFPLLEEVFGREPGTEIIVSSEQGRVTGIKIVKLAQEIDNHGTKK